MQSYVVYKTPTIWVKFRIAWGYSAFNQREWKYIEIPDEKFMKECGYEAENDEQLIPVWLIEEEGIDVDEPKGIEYEKIDNPPVSEVIRRLNIHRINIKHHQDLVDRYQKMLDELGHITKEDFDV
jgi:hypothetical protein